MMLQNSDGEHSGPVSASNSSRSSVHEDEGENVFFSENIKVEDTRNSYECCHDCGHLISDKYFLKVVGRFWHPDCLKCCVCSMTLDAQNSCYIKNDRVYCKADYTREFGVECSKCRRVIAPNDWVRHARNHVYHLACFACESCQRQLATGEEFALNDNKVMCKTHYLEITNNNKDREPGYECGSSTNAKSRSKRIRTTFSEDQLQILQANFQVDSNPDGQDLERIAQLTGLSKRVTQVWFQNSRARQKKYQNNSGVESPRGHDFSSEVSSPWDGSTPMDEDTTDIQYDIGCFD